MSNIDGFRKDKYYPVKVGRAGRDRFYICTEEKFGYGNNVYYLHRDLTLHKNCGHDNFYNTRKLAEQYTKDYFEVWNTPDFIKEEDFQV